MTGEVQIPDNLCIIPFIHLSTTTQGNLRPCCFSQKKFKCDGGDSLANFGVDSLESIWNSAEYRDLRLKMLANEKVQDCQQCWDEEQAGKRSKRVKENHKYLQNNLHLLSEAKIGNGHLEQGPFYQDIRLGNLCNLKCRSCNPACSTKIEAEQKAQWSKDFFLKNVDYGVGDNTWFKKTNFFKNVNTGAKDLKILYISGGEPLLNPEMYQLIKNYVDQGVAPEVSLRFNTNLTIFDDRFLDLLNTFKSVEISASIDAIADRLRYIRHPADWNKIEANFVRLVRDYPKLDLTVNCTVSSMNIFYLHEMYGWIASVKAQYGRDVHMSLDLVHEPRFLSVKNMPKKYREMAQLQIEAILNQMKLSRLSEADLKSLVILLNSVAEECGTRQMELVKYIEHLDLIRQESAFAVLPHFAEMVRYIREMAGLHER